MTRKKTTTGTMGSKRKTTESKAKAAVSETKASAPKQAEQKAAEVIPEVAVALLTEHPALPDRGGILAQFAEHFRGAKERAAAAAEEAARAAAAAPVASAEPEKSRGTTPRKRTPTIEPPRPRTPLGRPASEPVAAVSAAAIERAPAAAPVPAPVAAAAAPAPAPAPAAIAPTSDLFPAMAEPEPIGPPSSTTEPEPDGMFSPFAELEAEASGSGGGDDLFALLAGNEPPKRDDDEFGFGFGSSSPSEQSSPFLTAPSAMSAHRDDGSTTALTAVDDLRRGDDGLGTPIAAEGLPADHMPSKPMLIAPSESTTMIAAMPDEDPADADASARKSRKASKKKRG